MGDVDRNDDRYTSDRRLKLLFKKKVVAREEKNENAKIAKGVVFLGR